MLPPPVLARHCGGDRGCHCGDVVDKDYTLPDDLGPCEERGLAVASGATLDCAGHSIRGKGEQSADFGVVLSDNVSGATVKNCDISGFSRGIRLRGARKNRVIHNIVHHNGNFATHVGYGIDVAGAQENLFQDNHIHHNADEGIHVGTGSHGNRLVSNRIEDNVRENVYFLRADRGVLQKNYVRGGGANSVFIKHSSFLKLEHNFFYDRPVMLRGDSHDNMLTDNEFVKAGIIFQEYSEQGTVSSPTKNEVAGGSINEARVCVKFSGASGNIFRNVTLSHCTADIAAEVENDDTKNVFIGVAVKPETISLGSTSSIDVGWQLTVATHDGKGNPVGGVRVQGFDARKKPIFDVITGVDGRIPTQEVIVYSLRGSTKTFFSPYHIQATIRQTTKIQEVDVSENVVVTISLP